MSSFAPSSFAIVLLSYNHPELTATAVRSLREKYSGRLFLVHNGSEIRHRSSLVTQFPDVDHIVMEKNLGFSGGANRGLREAFREYEWALFFTNDCLAINLPELPGKPSLVAPLILFRKSDQPDSIGGGFNPHRGHLFHCKSEEEFRTLTARRALDSDLELSQPWASSREVLPLKKAASFRDALPYIPGSAFALHREVFEAVGGFDESLGTYWEDVDLAQRAWRAGFDLLADPKWQVRHKVGKTCHKHKEYTLYLYQRNRKRVSHRYARALQKPALYFHLGASWLRLSSRLLRSGRKQDLRLLWKAVRD